MTDEAPPFHRSFDHLPQASVKLIGEDGNAWSIIARCVGAARKAGWPKYECDFLIEALTDGTYEQLLAIVQAVFITDEDE